MVEAQAAAAPSTLESLQDRASTLLVAVYLGIAVVVFIAAPVLAANWFRTPFIGAFVENTLVFNGLGFPGDERWGAYNQGLAEFGVQLLSVDAQPVADPAGLQNILRAYAPGDMVVIEAVDLETGARRSAAITLSVFPVENRLSLFAVPYAIGLIYFLVGLWVFNQRRDTPAGRAFVLFATSAAITLASLFDIWTTNRLAFVWTASLLLSGSGIMITALVYPQELPALNRWPLLRWLPLLPAAVLGGLAYPALHNMADPLRYAAVWQSGYFFSATGIIVFLVWTLIRRSTSTSPSLRAQARLILSGALLSFLPLGIWFTWAAFSTQVPFSTLLLLPLVFFPLATAYAILRYRFTQADELIRRALVYASLTALTGVSYVLLVWGLGLVLGDWLPAGHPVLIGALVLLIAAAFNPLRDGLQHAIDRLFFRGRVVFQERLQEFGQDLTQVGALNEILALVHQYVMTGIGPGRLHVFLIDSMIDHFTAATLPEGNPTDLRFSFDSPLVEHLAQEQAPVFLGEGGPLPRLLQPERARLALLGAQLFVPMIGRKQLIGWLALSARSSGEPYGRRELSYLDSLSDQAALAVERAQVVADLQRRVHEMNVLGRVAQGINVTLNFDDILELIYAQTVQVIPAEHFCITLSSESMDSLQHVFYLEGDERIAAKENRPVPDGLGLEREVIGGQRAIHTEDYDSECRRRSVIPAQRGLYAWMGVPLNAGNQTIGALCLGSRDAAVAYTAAQQVIFQSIADQAAGAIVKTRLLEESERRTRQLESLNQAARSLTLELEIDPLLNRILESAVQIFNCEAGTLFLVDEETGEIEFTVVSGGAEELVGTRLPAGTGLVGKCIETCQPIIQNNVQLSKDWFGQTDQETGFTTRGLLVVPMQVRDQITGVIEIINKQDRTPFTADDERLLTAFSAQAAIAIQNARLFTMTDQALAARVDELSVMQRIDHELNASLDLSRAMAITLDWAMRQSGANAGLVAVVEEDRLRISGAQGYPFEAAALEEEGRLAGLPSVQQALAEGKSARRTGSGGLLPGASSGLAVPILRERKPIGLLLLESDAPGRFTPETAEFLDRLSDHAAIAIANASLYREIEEANLAKSDFISFVSHELKTPMTSIKGYADLLSAGAVGEVNEGQAGFLATIRSNVNRMSTLVSDLADVSRIEAGRLRLDFSAVAIKDVIDEVVRSARRQFDEKQQEIRLDLRDPLPPVWGDRTRLAQILANLVSNAVKYTPEHGLIWIEADLVEDPAGPPCVRVAVRDTGIGISPEDQLQVFTKFFRSEDQLAREVSGTGLGLNITKNLVEMQGGTIWFESEYRKGSAFYFGIPVAELN